MILGVTGTIGCGKSTVSAELSRSGWQVSDADKLCHELYDRRDRNLFSALKREFGEGIFNPDGSLSRPRLAEKVFADALRLEKLTALIYPALSARIDREITGARTAKINAAFELPLLYEGGFERKFDAVLAIWCAPEVRHARLKKFRNMSEEEIVRREARQLPDAVKLERADYVIINNGSPAEIAPQLKILFP